MEICTCKYVDNLLYIKNIIAYLIFEVSSSKKENSIPRKAYAGTGKGQTRKVTRVKGPEHGTERFLERNPSPLIDLAYWYPDYIGINTSNRK